MASSTPTDQTALMRDILDALKSLQLKHVQLASTVDAISGRVNVLAGMKEVHEAALPPAAISVFTKRSEAEDIHQDEHTVPESPSLPATTIDGSGSPSSALGHAKKTNTATGRIILT